VNKKEPEMKALKAYVEQKNAWRAIFKSKPLVIGVDNQRIADMIDGDLSPENLTCDGELPRGQVQARYRALTAAAQELQKLDPSVKFYEFS
jgi:hypothetical protein